jgi:hypothetical protein
VHAEQWPWGDLEKRAGLKNPPLRVITDFCFMFSVSAIHGVLWHRAFTRNSKLELIQAAHRKILAFHPKR